MSNLNRPVIVPERESAAHISGVRKTLQSVPRCLDEPRWLQETGNPKEEEEEEDEEEACVIKRYGEKQRAGSMARSGLIRAS